MLIIALTVIAGACATNPVTGKRQMTLLSEAEELAIGQQQDAEIRREMGVYDDQALQRYVSEIGQDVARASHVPIFLDLTIVAARDQCVSIVWGNLRPAEPWYLDDSRIAGGSAEYRPRPPQRPRLYAAGAGESGLKSKLLLRARAVAELARRT